MTWQTLLLIMAMAVVLMAWYANSSKRDKIYCSVTRPNKTKLHKFIKMTSRYIVFDAKRYDVIPSCIVFEWWDKGLIGMLFPQWVATLDFVYTSRYPKDPATGEPTIISPEVRQAMNKEEWVKSYAKGFTPPSAKKQSFFQQWLPWIAILVVALLGVYVYTNLSTINQNLMFMESQIKSIAK